MGDYINGSVLIEIIIINLFIINSFKDVKNNKNNLLFHL